MNYTVNFRHYLVHFFRFSNIASNECWDLSFLRTSHIDLVFLFLNLNMCLFSGLFLRLLKFKNLLQAIQVWKWKKSSYGSNHRRCSIKNDVHRYFAKFGGKHLCRSLSSNNVADLKLEILLKRDSRTDVLL